MVKFKEVADQVEITLQHQSYRGSDQSLWMTVRQTRLGPLINLAATGDVSPATARRLAHVLLVAADHAEMLPEQE